ncbi:MAG: MoaD/ThiS family protein [Acidimicrobiia bacterium]
MPTLRLFANLRESAGTDTATFEADTVNDLLARASDRFGEQFASGVAAARVWVNGEQADGTTPLRSGDEVALIPPVSGGALSTTNIDVAPNLLSVALVVSLLAVAWADESWYVLVAVGAILAWVWDLSETASSLRDSFVVYPALIGTVSAATGTFAWGFEGFAAGIAIGIVVAVAWPIFVVSSRDFRKTASTALVTMIAGSAGAGLVLIRLLGSFAVLAFVLVTIFALVGAWVAGVYGDKIQSIDANVGALLGALFAGLLAGLMIDQLDIAAGLLGGVAAAAGVISGRALGSMLRTGAVTHTEDAPGSLAMFDGAVMAAPIFWLALWLIG